MPKKFLSAGPLSTWNERMRSNAFKKLSRALRKDFYSTVPEEERFNLSAMQKTLLELIERDLQNFPLVYSKTMTNARNDKKNFVEPDLCHLFGYWTCGLDFQDKLMSEFCFEELTMITIRHFENYRSKYANDYKDLFNAVSKECEKRLVKNLEASEENLEPQFILEQFLQKYPMDELTQWQLHDFLSKGELNKLFALLVRRVECPLSIQTLHQSFDLYLLLLRIFHKKEQEYTQKQQEVQNSVALAAAVERKIKSSSHQSSASVYSNDCASTSPVNEENTELELTEEERRFLLNPDLLADDMDQFFGNDSFSDNQSLSMTPFDSSSNTESNRYASTTSECQSLDETSIQNFFVNEFDPIESELLMF